MTTETGDIQTIYGQAFDAKEVNPQQAFEPMPAGWYQAIVDEAEIKQTRKGDGAYLKLKFNILGERYNGRKVFANINLSNPSTEAQDIGMRQLSAIAHAIGELTIRDSSQILNKPLMVKLKVTQSEEFGASNDVMGYKAVEAQAQPTPAPSMPSQKERELKPFSPIQPFNPVRVPQANGINKATLPPWKR